jgi:hypothetical protein
VELCGNFVASLQTDGNICPSSHSTRLDLRGAHAGDAAQCHRGLGHTRAKQIDIRFHYLRELVERSVLSIEYVKTTAMLADGLTKPLPPVTFTRFVDMLGLRSRS